MFPNDEDEQDRLDMMHAMFSHMMHGKIFLAPIGPNPGRVIDIGTGTGIWAIDFGNIGTELKQLCDFDVLTFLLQPILFLPLR